MATGTQATHIVFFFFPRTSLRHCGRQCTALHSTPFDVCSPPSSFLEARQEQYVGNCLVPIIWVQNSRYSPRLATHLSLLTHRQASSHCFCAYVHAAAHSNSCWSPRTTCSASVSAVLFLCDTSNLLNMHMESQVADAHRIQLRALSCASATGYQLHACCDAHN